MSINAGWIFSLILVEILLVGFDIHFYRRCALERFVHSGSLAEEGIGVWFQMENRRFHFVSVIQGNWGLCKGIFDELLKLVKALSYSNAIKFV